MATRFSVTWYVNGDAYLLIGDAYLLIGDAAAAQDLVQDALITVFLRTRAGFTPDVAEA
jgi:hypothetical protein